MTEMDWGALAQDWLDRLAQCSEPGAGVTRLPFTPEHRKALVVLTELMEQAGLRVSLDAAGTLIGRLDGPEGAPVLLMGSHQDSVREGGAYDGIMGVVLPVLALQKLRGQGATLPFAVEVLAFADEEGVRFPTALMGPRVLAGQFDMAALDMVDREGVSLRAAMQEFGLEPAALPDLGRDPAQILGWIEAHLEQGPVLENAAAPLGIVTAICGIERHSVTLTGKAAHAGTMPMALRRDALAGAAELVLAVESLAHGTEGLMSNVGTLQVRPGAVNAVPGEVTLTVELRAPSDGLREGAGASLARLAREIAKRRGLELAIERTYAQPATPCADQIIARLSQAARELGMQVPHLPSGATHDTSAIADLCPVGMLFLRCREGISHHPDEFVDTDAMSLAIDTLGQVIRGYMARA
ncbi:allantoate deiminase [Roseinatronobacter bogoriensis subsp. barguzinensis]|uniref:Zn-dependent hydrolase n=2 Tax=Roseinatronobacter bogoriensis TaxID=119542 RepID=A0A2K8KLD0_9RHOB|nr:M20 family metallo-hydrolase [Rhodobaca barguzinensis]ATX67988.1 Zn-dependent hydrolase [Rhodobaca barguzinensis]MBB4206762.1 allantoate deiminase [Rhodobaca bogoriensis DSM 18756]TDW41506.1 allantoate deiminase [Rhodobaca barguzinensis]TDY74316.1 allantoate deiminase [Rhodobaca bogoriensis DSM 18756]